MEQRSHIACTSTESRFNLIITEQQLYQATQHSNFNYGVHIHPSGQDSAPPTACRTHILVGFQCVPSLKDINSLAIAIDGPQYVHTPERNASIY